MLWQTFIVTGKREIYHHITCLKIYCEMLQNALLPLSQVWQLCPCTKKKPFLGGQNRSLLRKWYYVKEKEYFLLEWMWMHLFGATAVESRKPTQWLEWSYQCPQLMLCSLSCSLWNENDSDIIMIVFILNMSQRVVILYFNNFTE